MTTTSTGQIKGEMGRGPFKGRGRLEDIVTELRRQRDARHDFVIDTRDLVVAPSDTDGSPVLKPAGSSALDFLPRAGLPMLDQAFVQLAQKAVPDPGVPMRFARRAWEHNAPRLADYLTGVMQDSGKRRMVRCLDDEVRAFLGDTYRTIDNLDIAAHALKVAQEHDAVPIEASVTDSHLRLRFVSRAVQQELSRVRDSRSKRDWFAGGLGAQDALRKVAANAWGELPGDVAHPALGFRNSETGHGGCDLDGGILLGVCFNLAWVRRMVHEVHLGARLEPGLFSAATAGKEAELIYAKVADAAEHYFTPETFAEIVARMEDAQSNTLRAPTVACNVAIRASTALSDGHLDALVAHFSAQPGGLTEFNLGQAVSRLAQDLNPNAAEEAENLAGALCLGQHRREIERATRQHEAELAAAAAS